MIEYSNSNKIYCCITTYNPDIARLSLCVSSIASQVDYVVIIDNGSANYMQFKTIFGDIGVEVIHLDSNLGIARAQNIVWQKSIEEGYGRIVFSDQDTIFPKNFVANLLERAGSDAKCAAISPVYKDVNAKGIVQVSVNIFSSQPKFLLGSSETKQVSHAISSGMIIRNEVASKIGLNNEELFIDWVDTEWCWRCYKEGFTVMQSGAVALDHALGENRLNLLGKKITRHKLFRSYYKIRNGILLYNLYDDASIRNHLFFHTLKNIILVAFSKGALLDKFNILTKAICDGLSGKGGKHE